MEGNMKLLGLDIGSNSVGSAWVDTDKQLVQMAVSIFPAGVEEREDKRGAPKNQARRGHRSQRRSIERRAERKQQMRVFLTQQGWIDQNEKKWMELNPWILRREGLNRELSPYEFGRALLHLTQRRGAWWFDEVSEEDTQKDVEETEQEEKDKEAKKIKGAIEDTKAEMKKRNARTFGELMAMKFEERRIWVGERNKKIGMPIRNRTKASTEGTYKFCADRDMIWEEFDLLWKKQKSFKSTLAEQLTNDCRKKLDDPTEDATWRYKGILFGQRKTYWDIGTMGRCDLEPTDKKCPKADMYAQEFLVLETLNNITIIPPGEIKRHLNEDERKKVLAFLKTEKNITENKVRKALGLHKGENKTLYTLSLEKDPKRELNTWWFYREIIAGAIGESVWEGTTTEIKESINKAILKFDPANKKDIQTLSEGCQKWWNFNEEQAKQFIEAWKKRSKIEDRVNFSRRSIKNLLPYMREPYWLTVNEARQMFCEDAENGATQEQRERYSFKWSQANHRTRQYLEKHPDMLPPAPEEISNPVVRKAIHEVRRHIHEWMRKFDCKPDRIVVELAREGRQSAIVRNKQLAENREREKERKKIIDFVRNYVDWEKLSSNQQNKAIKRVWLWREQKTVCAYSGETIAPEAVANGNGVEVDHIIPESRGGNSFLSNLVLCIDGKNRGKGKQTPREWLTKDEFRNLEQRLSHLKKENKIKWDNLHKEAPSIEEFAKSQLSDTAYASTQVADWLKAVLYDGERDGERKVFTTKGVYTSWLRRDWQLFPDGTDADRWKKDRSDHRHHTLDALVVALTDVERLKKLAYAVEEWEIAKAEGKEPPKRKRLESPWGTVDGFRKQVMELYENTIVCHRPARRRIAGELHKDEHFGAIPGDDEHFTKRIFAGELTPNHLRVPKGWEELRQKLENAKSESEKQRIRSQMLALEDVKPEKSGIVRDRWFREELRDCLRRNGFDDPDSFGKDKDSKKKFKEFVKSKGLILKSGVPVRRITLLRTLGDPVKIPRKQFDPKTGKIIPIDPGKNPSSLRVYDSQNNHHIEIREDKNGKWFGEVIRNYDAARRTRPSKASGQEPKPAVNRDDTSEGRFIMSLSIGETVKMKHPETRKSDYFVVFKIDKPQTIHFTPHYDAGRDKAKEKCPKREDVKKPGNKTGGLKPLDIQNLGIEPNKHPQKVWVGPLGDVKVLVRD
jgi:CRISPR-associated endonuclease Csn1